MARYQVDIWQRGELIADGTVAADSTQQAILRLARRAMVWPKRHGILAERVAGITWWAYPTRPARSGGTHIGERYIAHVREVRDA